MESLSRSRRPISPEFASPVLLSDSLMRDIPFDNASIEMYPPLIEKDSSVLTRLQSLTSTALLEKRGQKARSYLASRRISLETATYFGIGAGDRDQIDDLLCEGISLDYLVLSGLIRFGLKNRAGMKDISPVLRGYGYRLADLAEIHEKNGMGMVTVDSFPFYAFDQHVTIPGIVNGQIRNMFGRAMQKDHPLKHTSLTRKSVVDHNPNVFNPDALTDPTAGTVVLTEGIFDALSLVEAGITTVMSLNGVHNHVIDQAIMRAGRQGKIITLAFDNDATGRLASDQLVQELSRQGIRSVDLAKYIFRGSVCKDINELLVLGALRLDQLRIMPHVVSA